MVSPATSSSLGGCTITWGLVIPSYAVWAIRQTYPAPDDKYIPFMEYKEEEKRLVTEEEIEEADENTVNIVNE